MKRLVMAIAFLVAWSASCFGMTRAEIRDLAKEYLNQSLTNTTDAGWSDSVLNTLIDNGIKYTSGVTRYMTKSTLVKIPARANTVAMPSDFIEAVGFVSRWKGPDAAQDRSPRGALPAEPEELGKASGDRTTAARQFTDLGQTTKQLLISPTRNEVDSVLVIYVAYGRELTSDTAECDLPEDLQTAVADYVAWKAWKTTRAENPFKQDYFDTISPFVTKRERIAGNAPLPNETPGTQ